jgi:hypothetical protein
MVIEELKIKGNFETLTDGIFIIRDDVGNCKIQLITDVSNLKKIMKEFNGKKIRLEIINEEEES